MSHAPAGSPCQCGLRGWMPGIEHIPITWGWEQVDWIHSRHGKMTPRAVVDHIMAGFLTTMVDWALNRGAHVSRIIAHFGIARAPAPWSGAEARTVQFHPVFTPGIHVSAVINPVARIVLALGAPVRGANTYTVGIEHEGFSFRPPGLNIPDHVIWTPANPWPDPMVRASIRVKRWLFATVPSLGPPSRDSIIGHYEVDARNRPEDPARTTARAVWPVDRMLRELGGAAIARTHTVAAGETLSHIALRHGLSTSLLAEWNGITNPNMIRVGQVLVLEPPTRPDTPSPDTSPPVTPARPQAVTSMDTAAWEEFWRNGAEPLDFVTTAGGRDARYIVRRRA